MLHARTWADVDLSALEHNLGVVRTRVGPETDIMLVVKADGYGHGAVPVAWHLLSHGVTALGVGDSTEALELRAAGITAPIVILGAVVRGEMEDVARGDIHVTVHSGDRVRMMQRMLAGSSMSLGLHLKVDTGLGRLGCHPDRALGIARASRNPMSVSTRPGAMPLTRMPFSAHASPSVRVSPTAPVFEAL